MVEPICQCADQLMDYFSKHPQATEKLRGSLFEKKVIDLILKRANVGVKTVTPEELEAGLSEDSADSFPPAAGRRFQ